MALQGWSEAKLWLPQAVPDPESAQCPALPGHPQAREVKALGGGKETHLLQGLGQPLWVCAGHDGVQQRWEQRPRGSAHRVIRKCEGNEKRRRSHGSDPEYCPEWRGKTEKKRAPRGREVAAETSLTWRAG